MDATAAAKVLLEVCGACKKDEKILIVTDPASLEVGKAFFFAAKDYPNRNMIVIEETGLHGTDPNPQACEAMLNADVIYGCTKFSLFHAPARRAAGAKGARFVNMVDYEMRMLESGGLFSDFYQLGDTCMKIAEILDGKDQCSIRTARGTDITCSIKGRKPNPQIGRSPKPGMVSSPPDVEMATCAVEGTANGVVYIDGSIPFPGLGLIKDAIKLTVQESRIVKIEGDQQAETLKKILTDINDPNAFIIGEIGLGLNPECSLSGSMLEDEGCGGTIHFACGDNRSFGGHTACKLHLDMVFKNPTMVVDGVTILDEGSVACCQER
ncbi:aminopeptidase [Oscillibacter ruminantium]|uniref:aminopeptidase n=1 Tax=Oscillibacter ruminantium TaxID=1263547 RepID=UPI0033329AA2